MEKTAINHHMINDPRINVYECELSNYIKRGDWRNNSMQKKLILEAKIEINFRKLNKNIFRLFLQTLCTDFYLLNIKFFKIIKFLYKKN